MAKKEPSATTKRQAIPEKPASRAVGIVAQVDVKTGVKFAELMSAVMSDLVLGAMTPDVGNATCNAGGKLLKVVEMRHKYGSNLALIGPK
jgi:hypothetical protein